MLLPSGMCLCQFEDAFNSPAPATCPTVAQTPQTGRCQHCCKRTNVVAPALPARLAERTDSSPSPHEHHPDCPVLSGLSPRLTVVNYSAVNNAALVAVDLVAFDTPATSGIAPANCSPSPFASTPLFLSHCALLI